MNNFLRAVTASTFLAAPQAYAEAPNPIDNIPGAVIACAAELGSNEKCAVVNEDYAASIKLGGGVANIAVALPNAYGVEACGAGPDVHSTIGISAQAEINEWPSAVNAMQQCVGDLSSAACKSPVTITVSCGNNDLQRTLHQLEYSMGDDEGLMNDLGFTN